MEVPRKIQYGRACRLQIFDLTGLWVFLRQWDRTWAGMSWAKEWVAMSSHAQRQQLHMLSLEHHSLDVNQS